MGQTRNVESRRLGLGRQIVGKIDIHTRHAHNIHTLADGGIRKRCRPATANRPRPRTAVELAQDPIGNPLVVFEGPDLSEPPVVEPVAQNCPVLEVLAVPCGGNLVEAVALVVVGYCML